MSQKSCGPLTAAIVIPARLHSTRLPRKLLLDATGKTVLQHTYEAAARATKPTRICVAADGEEIAAAVRAFGGNVVLTDPNHASGSDRVAEVARGWPDVDIIVNVQGDEPDISAEAVDQVIGLLEQDPSAVMSTLATPIRVLEKLHDPACVKVVFGDRQRALYFSRSLIPHPRTWHDDLLTAEPPHFFQHIGLYAYRREFLLQIASLTRPALEQLESLEQLRVLHAGRTILVGRCDEPSIGIDTPADYAEFVARQRVNPARAA
jgi:3-deoxy-manno-octulosonate cytidylyltransferase (CMP-KDO synthetase)